MEKVTVYRFEYMDRNTGKWALSEDWATPRAIEQVGGRVATSTAREVDARLVHINGIVITRLE